ncbi:MAG: MFS transporter [Spirochaetes bacterium]|nr:MFS transporter [Spirochaetota bacterium]
MSDRSTKISALIVTGVSSFITPYMLSGVNIALPGIQKAFSIDAILLTWIATSYVLSNSVLLIPIGKIADIYGRKKIYIIGITIFVISNFLCAFAGSIEILITLRIILGIGAAMHLTTGVAIIISIFPVKERGTALGINVAAVYLGLSAGPFIGGLLTHYFSWQSIFITITPIGILSIILAVFFLKGEWADAKGEKFDLLGSIIYGASLIMIMYGVSILPQLTAFILLFLGIAGLFGFAARELKIDYPVFELTLFKHNKVFTFSSLAALINYASTHTITFLLSLYLQFILDLPPQTAGLVLISQPIVQAVFSPFMGKLSDKIDPGLLASIGMTINTVGLFMLIFLKPGLPIIFIIGILILLGFGYALFSSPNTNAIMSSVEKKHYGIASGTVATMRTIGMTLSMTISTLIFTMLIGKTEIMPAVYPAFQKSVKICFIIFTVLSTIGIYFSSTRGNLNREVNNV